MMPLILAVNAMQPGPESLVTIIVRASQPRSAASCSGIIRHDIAQTPGARGLMPLPSWPRGACLGAGPTDEPGHLQGLDGWQGAARIGKICFISAAPDKSEPTQVNGKPITAIRRISW